MPGTRYGFRSLCDFYGPQVRIPSGDGPSLFPVILLFYCAGEKPVQSGGKGEAVDMRRPESKRRLEALFEDGVKGTKEGVVGTVRVFTSQLPP